MVDGDKGEDEEKGPKRLGMINAHGDFRHDAKKIVAAKQNSRTRGTVSPV